MSEKKQSVVDDLLEPIRNWRSITPSILVLPGTVMIFIGAAAFLLTRSPLWTLDVSLGVNIVLWLVEAGLVALGAVFVIYGFAAKTWPKRR